MSQGWKRRLAGEFFETGAWKGGMSLPAEVEELIASLRRQIAALEAEVADLRRRLGRTGAQR